MIKVTEECMYGYVYKALVRIEPMTSHTCSPYSCCDINNITLMPQMDHRKCQNFVRKSR